jgi:DNA mismatch repair protein MSH5
VTKAVDLDKYVGDLHSNIVGRRVFNSTGASSKVELSIDREIEIIQGLAERVLPAEDVIAAAADACAELDVLLALSAASRAFDYRQPQMVEQDIIHIIGGRHPLQEQVVDTFVPNDLALGGDSLGEVKRMVICTGANACGKVFSPS